MNVASALKPGENLIAVAATNTTDNPSPAGLIGLLSIKLGDGRTIEVPTDPSWETSVKAVEGWNASAKPAEGWAAAMQLGPLGMAPWGEVGAVPAAEEVFPAATAVHQWLAKEGLPPDFRADRPLRYIHRRIGEADVYFVANGSTEACSRRSARSALRASSRNCGTPRAAASRRSWRTKRRTAARTCRCGWGRRNRCSSSSGDRPKQPIASCRPRGTGRSCSAWHRLRLARKLRAGTIRRWICLRDEIWQPGSYVFKTADGRSREVKCQELAAPRGDRRSVGSRL